MIEILINEINHDILTLTLEGEEFKVKLEKNVETSQGCVETLGSFDQVEEVKSCYINTLVSLLQ